MLLILNMKVKLLKKIRKNCHIQIIRREIAYDFFRIYDLDFESSIEIKGQNNWLYFLDHWRGFFGCSEFSLSQFKLTRKIRQNKKEFRRNQINIINL